MSQPSITGNTGNILVTAADVLVGDPGNQVDLGFVSKVSVNVKHLVTEVKTDQAGKMDVDDRYVGDQITVEMEMDELTALKLSEAYTFGSYISNGSASRIAWGQNIGASAYALAKQIVIRPTVDDIGNVARNWVFYKAAPVGDSKIGYTPDNKAVIKTTFKVYPDFQKANGEYLGYFGDITAGVFTHAFESGLAAGSNTGTGTIAGFSCNDTYTKTEVWTTTCIAASGGGASGGTALFSVVGTVSGAKGVATTGHTFNSNSITPSNSEIIFEIFQGATNFVVGDSFTFNTTAANYST